MKKKKSSHRLRIKNTLEVYGSEWPTVRAALNVVSAQNMGHLWPKELLCHTLDTADGLKLLRYENEILLR